MHILVRNLDQNFFNFIEKRMNSYCDDTIICLNPKSRNQLAKYQPILVESKTWSHEFDKNYHFGKLEVSNDDWEILGIDRLRHWMVESQLEDLLSGMHGEFVIGSDCIYEPILSFLLEREGIKVFPMHQVSTYSDEWKYIKKVNSIDIIETDKISLTGTRKAVLFESRYIMNFLKEVETFDKETVVIVLNNIDLNNYNRLGLNFNVQRDFHGIYDVKTYEKKDFLE